MWNWPRGEPLGRTRDWKHAVLRRLALGHCALDELRTLAGPGDPLDRFLARLRAGGWLQTTVCHDGRPWYTVRPARPPVAETAEPAGTLTLSRFAIMRREGDALVLQSPVASASVVPHDPAALAVLLQLAEPRPWTPTGGWADRMLRHLCRAGLVVAAGSEDRTWSPHELWFHERSRLAGQTWSAGEPPETAPAVDLYRPDLALLRRHDVPLASVLGDRHAVKEHDDDNPITVDQLGELLYRCTRGHPLELYPLVIRVSGLDPGLYRHDPVDHLLWPVRRPGPRVERLVTTASRAALTEREPQVLLIVAARFDRFMPATEALAYPLILKETGALAQTVCLVAASMGLAGYELGIGDSAAFAEATGLHPMIESSVGELVIGSSAVR
jgi:SagB-type dehydrogenase family enzyme